MESTINLQPRFETLSEKKLIGMRMTMSFANNRTRELWQSFMPRRREIANKVGAELYSLEVYSPLFFKEFDLQAKFEKWAAVEVKDYVSVPEGMEKLIVPSSLYAVFIHKGPASEGPKTYNYIFRTWLPNSEYALDNRPHFALMGEKYKHEDESSEEEIWIPVRLKDEIPKG